MLFYADSIWRTWDKYMRTPTFFFCFFFPFHHRKPKMSFFGKFLAQMALVSVQVVTKAFVQAYQRAQTGGGAEAASAMRSAVAGTRMSLDQARAVLHVGEKGAYSSADVINQYEKYFKENDPDSGGSFYVQSKIHNAREVLLAEFKDKEAGGRRME